MIIHSVFLPLCIWVLSYDLSKKKKKNLQQKGLLIRLERKESLSGRLAMLLRSPVPTLAPLPKTTATDHFSFNVHGGVSLQQDLIQQAVLFVFIVLRGKVSHFAKIYLCT